MINVSLYFGLKLITEDQGCWYLSVHRYYIQTEILHFTIILHVSFPAGSKGEHIS